MSRALTWPAVLAAIAVAVGGLALAAATARADVPAEARDTVRFATFNASLNRNFAGQLVSDLSTPANAQARTVAEIARLLKE